MFLPHSKSAQEKYLKATLEGHKKANAKSEALKNKSGSKPKFFASQMRQHGGFPDSEIKKAERHERKNNI